jgi:large subunit ribosomal protein L20
MPRVKRGRVRARGRRALHEKTKGYRSGRRSLVKLAKTAVKKAGVYAFRDRRAKKRTRRQLWSINLNAAVREYGLSYSKFINLLKKNKIELDRKVLVEIAQKYPAVFAKIVESVKK